MLKITDQPSVPWVAASILSADFGNMAADCHDILSRGADLLHIDVMDGHFVPNLTMGRDMIAALRRHCPQTYLDVHLMVTDPGAYLESFAQAGANMFTFHLEVCCSDAIGALIDRIHQAGMDAGIAINPPTDPQGLAPWLSRVEMALVMSVNPGRSGQSFIPGVLDKARWIKSRLSDRTRLQMDGGLNPRTAPEAIAAGVDVIVSASALFGAADRSVALKQLRGLAS